ncbi:hypothetical protein [Niveibacterium sp. COAC-50]|uniref:hypothetical protein n=1 Tax=Niveibacterium sp. COAC-50 TaxID=2729384 RepID=UPI001555F067|nr:hypothetical protein [Niveibacterium sp. COAC-50]
MNTNMNRLDDVMNALLVVVFACLAMLTAIGVSDGKSFGRSDVQISVATAEALSGRPVEVQQVPRITVVAKRPVAVVASAY